MLRISSTVDVRIRFSANEADAATSADMLFLAGSEAMPLPFATNFINAVANDGASSGSLSITVLQ